MGSDSTSTVDVAEINGSVVVRFRRPEKRNALTVECVSALRAALAAYVETPLPIVFTSATPGMFVAGSDVNELRSRTVGESLTRSVAGLYNAIEDYPWPTIAAVDGPALGGGLELALACDFRIATERSRWGLPELTLGIIPSAGGLVRLPRLIGESLSRELILTGRRLDGFDAEACGLITRLVGDGDLDRAVNQLVDELSVATPLAIQLAKEAMRVTGDSGRLVDAMAQALCLGSREAQQRLERLATRNSDSSSAALGNAGASHQATQCSLDGRDGQVSL